MRARVLLLIVVLGASLSVTWYMLRRSQQLQAEAMRERDRELIVARQLEEAHGRQPADPRRGGELERLELENEQLRRRAESLRDQILELQEALAEERRER